MASLEGKVFALTGAASGIGLSTARVLAARGASLSLSDVNKAGLEAAVASLSNGQHQGKFAAFHTDVADRSSVRDFVQNTLKQFGKLDGCANIAGVAGKDLGVNSLWESDSADFDFVMAVNAKGVFNCLTEELQPSVLQEGGSIVNIASIAGLRAMPKSASYCASKHAVIGLTRCAADDAGPRGIRVNAVAPGAIDTPMLRHGMQINPETVPHTPLPREGKPEEIGEVVAFLLSDQSSFVTGSVYSVDGGWNAST